MATRTPTVYLHIGPPKTGTTFVQQVLWHNRRVLRAAGVSLPGKKPIEHFHAALDLRGITFGGYDNPATTDAWPRLAKLALEVPTARVLISHEAFGGASRSEIDRLVDDLQPAEVHVVYGVRDLARQLPAVWQESLKNRTTRTFDTFLERALAPGRETSGPRGFWRSQHPIKTMSRWASRVPADRIHVVTLPPKGSAPTVLWERFCSVLDLDASAFVVDAARSNRSLSVSDAEVLRRLNSVIDESVPWPQYEAMVKSRFNRIADAGGAVDPDEKLVVPVAYRDRITELAGQFQAELSASGYDIVGDLDDLTPSDDSFGPAPTPQPDKVADAAVALLAAALADQRGPRNSPALALKARLNRSAHLPAQLRRLRWPRSK